MNAISTEEGEKPCSDILLASLPFGVLHSPSLALAILQARLGAAGFSATCRHFALDYASIVGRDLYIRIAAGFPRTTDLLGEWIFSHALSPKTLAQQKRYLARTFGGPEFELVKANDASAAGYGETRGTQLLERILWLADSAKDFVDHAAREILKYAPKVVGLTSVFQQNMASLAVAARLRQLDASVKIILGGANCEGSMGRELARCFPFVDLIVSGEADLLIVPLVQCLLAGEDPHQSPRVRPYIEPVPGGGSFMQTKMVADLNDYPTPSFDDYFGDLRRLWGDRHTTMVQLPLETSRGCWWGMKNHCTFCGLNGATMTFRSRRPADALQEIVSIAAKYPEAKISFVDNIMDYKYFDLLLPHLAQLGSSLDLFYEIKSNVSKPQLKALKDAGVRHVQPGIESLSDQVLRIMKKGVSAVQNIQLLKWCAEFGVKVDWNLLWGFPREDPDEYRSMASLIPLLCHLQPPARGSEIRLDRFSPNFTQASQLGFFNLRPYPAYFDVYERQSQQAVFNLSYFFQADSAIDEKAIEAYTRDLLGAIQNWRACHSTCSFTYLELGGRVLLFDARSMLNVSRVKELDALQSKVFLLCDTARSHASICRELPDVSSDDIARTLQRFCEEATMWFDGHRYLSLAISFTTFLESRGTRDVESAINILLSKAATNLSDASKRTGLRR
ncbi:hypothetical protein LMG28727_06202 [Paraburkholderia kirstenboschensis]|uniref:RiPP maturation radical SAM C-methyltransferase n=1 Tax=Paraburkholderia kirstenboschensis TaxID=1245436 RepID=UPI000FFC0F63|nr:RiPP maturation radical SAM C-methyltransferase [Paraburkholderia kirstenboschensis]CAD6556813.1 hypothetical protein LMG28727_06202 [Paraburkholderia kirstenboschensis]